MTAVWSGKELVESSRKAIFVLIKSLQRKHGLAGGFLLSAGLRPMGGQSRRSILVKRRGDDVRSSEWAGTERRREREREREVLFK